MEPSVHSRDEVLLAALRRRRADLRGSISAMESALAAPAPGRHAEWAHQVRSALDELADEFREHIDITEGPTGFYRELLDTAPRLSNMVTGLTADHADIQSRIDGLLADVNEERIDEVQRVRELGTQLLGRLVRHRQRGSDLVFEAYSVDIGGET